MRWARAQVDAQRDALMSLVDALVATPSVNPPGDVRASADVLARWLLARGLEAEVVSRTPDKPNLVVTIEGTGPGLHLGLNGHLDTIPPGDEAAWSVPVWQTRHRNGLITGLGVGNMKAGMAALTLATVLIRDRGGWPGRLTLTAVADETVFGPDGAGWLLEQRPELLGDMLICGEGAGNMGLAVAEKGLMWVRLTATAPSRQGMTIARGATPVAWLVNALAEIDSWNDLTVSPPPELAGVIPNAGDHGLRLSANPGTMSAPGFVSQMAAEAVAEIDFRIPPGLTRADVGQKLDAVCAQCPGLSWDEIKGWDPNWTDPATPLVSVIEASFQEVRGEPARPVVRLPASDSSRWRARGIPAVCLGPQGAEVSGTDDWVLEENVIDCAAIYAEAAVTLLNAGRT